MENFSSEVCILCRKGFDVDVNRVSVTNKGLQSIAEFLNDTWMLNYYVELRDYLATNPPEVNVHSGCRKRYTDRRRSSSSAGAGRSPVAKKT